MKKTVLLICLISVGLLNYAQKPGRYYRTQAKRLQEQSQLSLAKQYYDSAYQKYINDSHFASAALTYISMRQLFENDTMSSFKYLKQVYDSSKTYKKYDKNTFILRLKHDLAEHFFQEERYDSALLILNETTPRSIEKFGPNDTTNIHSYQKLSALNYFEGNLNLAIYWMNQNTRYTKEEDELVENWMRILEYSILLDNSDNLTRLKQSNRNFHEKDLLIQLYEIEHIYLNGNLSSATKRFQQLGDIDSLTLETIQLKHKLLQSTLLFENGDFNKSLEIAKSWLPIGQKLYHESHPVLSKYYLLVSKIYYEKSDFGASKEFSENLLYAMNKKLKDRHPVKAQAYYEYSRALFSLERTREAKIQIDSAISISKRSLQDNCIFLGLSYGQKGAIYNELNVLDSSEYFLQESLKILKKSLDNKNHVYIAKVLSDLGVLYQAKGQDKLAIDHFLRSLGIYRKILGQVHPHLGMGYNNVAKLHMKNNDYESALNMFQTAMHSNVFDFTAEETSSNPSTENVLSDFILLKSLSGKVEALDSSYQKKESISLLHISFQTYNLITELIDKLRTGYVSAESKNFLSEKTSYLYERAIQVCLELSKQTGDDMYRRYAFKFSEKSRTGMLLAGIKDAKAKQIAGVPDSLITVEQTLVYKISQKQNDLFEELNKGRRSRNTEVSKLKEELFHLRNTYADHINYLEQRYRNYFQLKYDSYTSSVEDVRKNLLKPRNSKDKKSYQLIEYFIGQDAIYRFQITNDDYELHVTRKPSNFDGLVKGLRNSIKYQMEVSFVSISNLLGSMLLPDSIGKNTHLTIIPDGILSYLPFESLIVTPSTRPTNKQDFLIKNSTISYSYSATLSVEMTLNEYEKEVSNSFTGFAPVFDDRHNYVVLSSDKQSEINRTIADQNYVASLDNFSVLPNSKSELIEIHQKLKSRNYQTNSYFYAAASKENLLSKRTLNSRFLHFATHGLLNTSHPEYSGIVLSDSLENDILTIGEVYGLDLNTEIVTLSACETGMGRLIGGEGLVSFSRSFFYTGAKFIIVSLWKVDDEATSDVMKHFYQKYARKKKSDIYKSFQKARMKAIKKKKFNNISDWFPFVLVGMD